jgi:biotin carboxyl carrier protein
MLKANVDDQRTFEIKIGESEARVGDQPFSYEIATLSERLYHVLHAQKSYNVEILEADYAQKFFLLKINGRPYRVRLQDRFDQLIEELGMEEDVADATFEIIAPMPGLVLKIHVEAGTEVHKDDPLVTLEAMKMENVLKSPGDGLVEEVVAKQGDSVEKSQLLLRLS